MKCNGHECESMGGFVQPYEGVTIFMFSQSVRKINEQVNTLVHAVNEPWDVIVYIPNRPIVSS